MRERERGYLCVNMKKERFFFIQPPPYPLPLTLMSVVLSDRKSQKSPSVTPDELSVPITGSDGHSEEGILLQELFGDIDWTQANLGELEQQWRNELTTIEQVKKVIIKSFNDSFRIM